MTHLSGLVRRAAGLLLAACVLAGCGARSAAPEASAPALHPTWTPAALAAMLTIESTPTATTPSATPTLAPVAAPATATLASTPGPSSTAAHPIDEPTAAPTAGSPTASPTPPGSAPSPTTAAQEPAHTAVAGPVIRFFRVTPTTTQNVGDALSMTWEAKGGKAELCPISGPGPVESRCQDVPMAGTMRYVTDEEAMAYVGFGLRVSGGGSFTWSLVNVNLRCQDLRPWFFDDPPPRCPADLVHESAAAGQYFEGGLMVWVEDPDSFYVFYRGRDEEGFQTFDWISDIRQKPGASPDNRVGDGPPAGLCEPVSGFGMVWRGEIEGVRSDVRQRLGWAAQPEFAFHTSHQCETTFYPGLWTCFLRGPRGEILELYPDSTAQVRWLWEERTPTP